MPATQTSRGRKTAGTTTTHRNGTRNGTRRDNGPWTFTMPYTDDTKRYHAFRHAWTDRDHAFGAFMIPISQDINPAEFEVTVTVRRRRTRRA